MGSRKICHNVKYTTHGMHFPLKTIFLSYINVSFAIEINGSSWRLAKQRGPFFNCTEQSVFCCRLLLTAKATTSQGHSQGSQAVYTHSPKKQGDKRHKTTIKLQMYFYLHIKSNSMGSQEHKNRRAVPRELGRDREREKEHCHER